MRDKVLCRGWKGKHRFPRESILFLIENCSVLLNFSVLRYPQCSVPVSVQGGVKLSIDKNLSLFDFRVAHKYQKAHKRFLDTNSRQELDTICVTDSLFKGTVVDLNLAYGGGMYAEHSLTAK